MWDTQARFSTVGELMTTARQAFEGGGTRTLEAEFDKWILDYAKTGMTTEEDQWTAEASAMTHDVPQGNFKRFRAAIGYGLWEEWGSTEPPFPCPRALIEGYAAE